MRRFIVFSAPVIFGLVLTLSFGCGSKSKPTAPMAGEHGGHSDNQSMEEMSGAELIVSTSPKKPEALEPVELRLMLHDKSGKMLKDLEVIHEKLAHLIIVREGLDKFAHIHPKVHPDGNITIKHTFPIAGTYHLYLDYQAKGMSPATGQQTLVIAGDAAAAPALKVTAPGDVIADGLLTKVSVEASKKSAVLRFDLRNMDGTPVNDLEPYLGAMGHLVVISNDAKEYVHAHPLPTESGASQVSFEAHFPGPGIYKAWGQFKRAGTVVTVPAVIDYQDSTEAHSTKGH